jgi:hypothetical protein
MPVNDFDDFRTRFEALAAEARQYGIQPIVLLYMDDPIVGVETFYQGSNFGPRMNATGMLKRALENILKEN